MRTRPLFDVVALLTRTAVGVVFVVHGWQKIQVGIRSTEHAFKAMGVPLPTAAAVFSTFAELLGGAALILGLALPVAGVLLFLDMLGALVFVNGGNGLRITGGDTAHQGYELVLVLGLACLLIAVGGGGRYTLDRRIFPRRRDPFGDEDDETPPWREEDPAKPKLVTDMIEGDSGEPGDVRVAGRRGRPVIPPADPPRAFELPTTAPDVPPPSPGADADADAEPAAPAAPRRRLSRRRKPAPEQPAE